MKRSIYIAALLAAIATAPTRADCVLSDMDGIWRITSKSGGAQGLCIGELDAGVMDVLHCSPVGVWGWGPVAGGMDASTWTIEPTPVPYDAGLCEVRMQSTDGEWDVQLLMDTGRGELRDAVGVRETAGADAMAAEFYGKRIGAYACVPTVHTPPRDVNWSDSCAAPVYSLSAPGGFFQALTRSEAFCTGASCFWRSSAGWPAAVTVCAEDSAGGVLGCSTWGG